MEKHLFADYSEQDRLQMLQDNCSKVLEDYGYNKPLSQEQFKAIKDKLSSASVSLHDVQEEKKAVDAGYAEQIKSLKGIIADQVRQLKTRSTYTCERCFEVIDYDEKKVGVYTKEGVLIEERAATLMELREPKNMFASELKKTGTHN